MLHKLKVKNSLIKEDIFLIELIEIFAVKYFSFENADLMKKRLFHTNESKLLKIKSTIDYVSTSSY